LSPNSIILQKPWTYTGALRILMNLPTQSSRERLQTAYAIEIDAPNPQEFVFAIRVAQTREKALQQGMTTVPITYLGKPQK
jgi:hypothetical protein